MTHRFSGSCLCKGITFSVEGFSEKAAHCYCSMCRKFHGAAFGTLVEVQGLKWHTGRLLLKEFVAENGTVRVFCEDCGSSLGFRPKGAPFEKTEIAIAAFDEEIPVVVDAQIYTAYKANWSHLDQELKIYPEGREGP